MVSRPVSEQPSHLRFAFQRCRTRAQANGVIDSERIGHSFDTLSTIMTLADETLIKHLQLAYSAEKAAAFAYVGHAASLSDPIEQAEVRQIEQDEWHHRREVLTIMQHYNIPVSRWYEVKYHLIGKVIGFSCHVIGRFMPFFFAGRLESGNVCEYMIMVHRFHRLGITEHDEILTEMGLKEKEHEDYFGAKVANSSWLPLFETVFGWSQRKSLNDVGANRQDADAEAWCTKHPAAPRKPLTSSVQPKGAP